MAPQIPRHSAWANLAPGNYESASKCLSGKTWQGSVWLRTALVEAAQASVYINDTYPAAQYRRLAVRRGVKCAMVAVAHTIMTIIYHLLRHRTTYCELGSQYFDERDRQATEDVWSAVSQPQATGSLPNPSILLPDTRGDVWTSYMRRSVYYGWKHWRYGEHW